MKKLMTLAFALTIAAAMAMTISSCSSDDVNEVTPRKSTTEKIHVTIGAGIDNVTTRSTVADDGTNRTLKFTTGDKLYVYGVLECESKSTEGGIQQVYTKIMTGYLDLVDGDGSTSARFSGDLTVYKANEYPVDNDGDNDPDFYKVNYSVDNDYSFNPGADPLAVSYNYCTSNTLIYGFNIKLVHKDAGANFVVESNTTYPEYGQASCNNQFSADVNTTMHTNLNVETKTYDPSNKSVALASNQAIFNCNISGLTAGDDYDVSMILGDDPLHPVNISIGTVTADADKKVIFAFPLAIDGYEHIYTLKIGDNNINLGSKTLAKKIYKITRTWNGSAFVTP